MLWINGMALYESKNNSLYYFHIIFYFGVSLADDMSGRPMAVI